MATTCVACGGSWDNGREGDPAHVLCSFCLPSVPRGSAAPVESLTDHELDTLPFGLLRVDASDRIVGVNRAEQVAAQAPRDLILGKPLSWHEGLLPALKDVAEWIVELRKQARRDHRQMSYVSSGEKGRVLMTVTAIHEPVSQVTTILVRRTRGMTARRRSRFYASA